MARKRPFKKNLVQPIRPDLRERFLFLIAEGKKKPEVKNHAAGFETKNINQLWRWDTMEDV